MGIAYRDLRPKPAYIAYSTLTRVLQGLKLAGPVAAPEGTFAFRFAAEGGGTRSAIALWSPKEDAEVTVPVDRPAATRVNAVGETAALAAQPSGAGKAVTFRLRKGAPAYVLLE
jgi:hypothetical protein